jgi:hypothetical protein
MTLPKTFHQYFWDVNPDQIDLELHKNYVIQRILRFADVDGWQWISDNYQREEVINAIFQARGMDAKNTNFYTYIYDLT